MIDLNNLLIYSFDKEFIPEKKYNIKFDIKLKLIKSDKDKCIQLYSSFLKDKENKINKVIELFNGFIKGANKQIEIINQSKEVNLKKIDFPKIKPIYKVKEEFCIYKNELYKNFFDIFFSTEFNANILSKNLSSLSSVCDIIEYCKFNTEYIKNITSVISAVLMQTNSINFMYPNLRKLLSNRNLKINVEDLIPNINEVCSWTKEIMEKKDKEDRLMPILIHLLEIIIKNIDYTSKEQ